MAFNISALVDACLVVMRSNTGIAMETIDRMIEIFDIGGFRLYCPCDQIHCCHFSVHK